MQPDAGRAMKDRMRADLRLAMAQKRSDEVRVIRALVAAIDNAEAPPPSAAPAADQHRFHSGSAEVERLCLDAAQLRRLLLGEVHEREHAAAEMDRLKRTDRRDALRADAAVARRYADSIDPG